MIKFWHKIGRKFSANFVPTLQKTHYLRIFNNKHNKNEVFLKSTQNIQLLGQDAIQLGWTE